MAHAQTTYPLLLICLSSPLLAAQVDKTEKALVASINRHNASHTELLSKLVNRNSGTMNFEGVQAVGQALRTEFDALGMETQWVDGTAFNRAGHLVARTKGTKGPKFLLIG